MAASHGRSGEIPPHTAQTTSQTLDPNVPPAPPPKPCSREVSRQNTPAVGQPSGPLLPDGRPSVQGFEGQRGQEHVRIHGAGPSQSVKAPGDRWLPNLLEDKSKQDLVELLSKPGLLSALVHSRSTSHPSTAIAQEQLQAALAENVSLASHLEELESQLLHLRGLTQAQLLSTHALERQWRQKQSDMDRALLPFSPSSLYQRLGQGVQEQEIVCRVLEESFVEEDGGMATEREITEWVRRYRDAKKLYYSRQERKQRWDEARVGGWR